MFYHILTVTQQEIDGDNQVHLNSTGTAETDQFFTVTVTYATVPVRQSVPLKINIEKVFRLTNNANYLTNNYFLTNA